MDNDIFHMNKNLILFSLLIFLNINNSKSSYVTIPFKIYRDPEPSTYSSLEDYFTYNSELKYYGQISMGESESPIPLFFTFNDYGFYFVTKGTDLGDISTSYDPSSSPSCQSDPKGNIYFKNYGKAIKSNDTFIFNSDTNNPLKCKKLKFLYATEDNKKKNSFLMIGLRLLGDILRDDELNIIKQLKQNKYIDTYDWSIHYDEKNPEKEGVLLIGTEPHKYNPQKYNQNYYFNSVNIIKYAYGEWCIEFDKIYFMNDYDEEVEVDDFTKFTFKHQSGLISGTSSYERLLKQYFFDELISSKECSMETSSLYTRVYVCTNTEKIKNKLRKKFPPLKLLNKPYMKTFELTYEDLFKEKSDKIYFLVYFSSYQGSSWGVGLPFLKKYFLNYNYDSKLISYYNNDLANIKYEKDSESGNSLKKVVIIIVLIIFITIIGFFFGKRYISMRMKQKISARELENDFRKQISESEYKPPSNEKENSKYSLI